MRIEIEIPKEFEEHFKQDRFEDTLHRLSADAHLIAGNYEQETAIMLIKAFRESKPAYDIEKVATRIKEQYGCKDCEYVDEFQHPACNECAELEVIDDICDIVRKGGVE